jgi:hypothetical protein
MAVGRLSRWSLTISLSSCQWQYISFVHSGVGLDSIFMSKKWYVLVALQHMQVNQDLMAGHLKSARY